MKIGIKEIEKGIFLSAKEKICSELVKQGFAVFEEKSSTTGNFRYDIYAEKSDEKRIYELKIGKNKIYKNQLARLQEEAKKIKAKLFIVYLEVPKSKQIDYDDLDQIIFENLLNNFPTELDTLSTHTSLESVNNVDIESINVQSAGITLSGSASLDLDLQFGSNYDIIEGDGLQDSTTIDFYFRIRICNDKIVASYYKFDLPDC